MQQSWQANEVFMSVLHDLSSIEVITPNLKRRLSGVTATVARLVPVQRNYINIVATGYGLPKEVPCARLWQMLALPRDRWRVWHARRNDEMLIGWLLKAFGRRKLRLVFTSADPRERTGWTKFLLSKMDATIGTSQKTAAVMPEGCVVIPHGVDTGFFHPEGPSRRFFPDYHRVIGCFGRIRDDKGTHVFIEAMCRVLPHYPNWSALALGRVTPQWQGYMHSLQILVQEAGLEERIKLLPEMPVGQINQGYRGLSLFVAPSIEEGFGLTPLEAMAAGVPTIATRGAGAYSDLVDEGRTGFLFEAGNVEDLAAYIRCYLDDPQKLAAAGQAARAHVLENFSIETEAKALVEVYRRLLDGAG